MPTITFKTRDEIPEGLKGTETEANGVFTVKVVSQAKLDEFRDNNLAIARERDELKNKVAAYASLGDDPAKVASEYAALKAIDQQVKDGKLKGTDAIEQTVNQRLQSAREEYERKIREAADRAAAAESKALEADTKLKRSIIDRAVTQAVLDKDSGLNPAALPDILTRAYATYVVGEGDKLVAKNGDVVIYGSDGISPMQPKEWLGKLVQEAPHFAKPSAGGGATGGEAGKQFGGLSQEAFNKLPPAERIAKYRAAQAGK